MKRAVLLFGIYLLWFAAVFDPVGSLYQLRYIALAYALTCVVLSFWMGTEPTAGGGLSHALIFLLAVLMPIYGFALYAVRGGAVSFVDTSYLAAGILVLTRFMYRDPRLCQAGIQAMTFSLRILTALIISIYVAMFYGFNSEWISFFTEGNSALIASREYGGVILPYIYFLASPMLIYLIAYDLHQYVKRRTWVRLLLCMVTMFAFALSGTRAHIVLAIAYAPIYYLLLYSRRKILTACLTGLVGTLIVLLINPDLITEFFSPTESSNELKLQLFDMYYQIFSDPTALLFGQGYNAHEWSAPLREKLDGIENASKTELTYIELVRVYGIFISSVFFVLLGVLVHRISKLEQNYRWLYPAFLIFMVNTALNPYLFSTNGMLPLALLLGMVSLKGSVERTQLKLRQRPS